MQFDYSKLRYRIRERCATQDAFAAELGLGRVSLSKRLNNSLEFTQQDMKKACEILKIVPGEIADYFFAEKVQ